MKTICPLNEYCVLEKTKQKTEDGGIIIPSTDNDKDSYEIGRVVKLPSINESMYLKTGIEVIYKKFSSVKIKLENKDFILIKFEDLMGSIEEQE